MSRCSKRLSIIVAALGVFSIAPAHRLQRSHLDHCLAGDAHAAGQHRITIGPNPGSLAENSTRQCPEAPSNIECAAVAGSRSGLAQALYLGFQRLDALVSRGQGSSDVGSLETLGDVLRAVCVPRGDREEDHLLGARLVTFRH